MSKHTPGQWTVKLHEKYPDCAAEIWGKIQTKSGVGGNRLIAKTSDGNAQADARLIAAAPDLLEALEDVILWIENWSPEFTEDPEWQLTSKLYQTAIAKAKGKA